MSTARTRSRMMQRRAAAPSRPGTRATLRQFVRDHRWTLAAVVTLLFFTCDDRHPGVIADGRQMIWTAIAITESGGLGQAQGRDLTVRRSSGDAVSRYGVAMSLAQVPAAGAAPIVEGRFGPGSSQPLFLIAPFLFVVAAGTAAGLCARELGAGTSGQRAAILLATIAGPFAAYASMPVSEALQGAAIVTSYLSAVIAVRTGSGSPAFWSGIAAGVAVLTKSSLLVVAPLGAVPLFSNARRRAFIPSFAAGILPLLGCWLYLELTRFGRPLASYGGERFSHPFFDGLWRLIGGVNKGVLWYFPAALVAMIAAARAIRSRDQAAVTKVCGILPAAALIALAASWWSWDGSFGWGPRLVVPGVPLLAVVAAAELERWRPAARHALLAASVAINLPGLVTNATLLSNYELVCTWPEVSAAEAASFPTFARQTDGTHNRVVPASALAKTGAASPFLTHPWFQWASTTRDAKAAADRLMRPPWVDTLREVKPSSDAAREIIPARRFSFWGRGFFPEPAERAYGQVYDSGLTDQALRAQQIGDTGLAFSLADKLSRLAPGGFADALMLECYRLTKNRPAAVSYLTALPSDRRSHPAINVVLALFERDAGNETAAHQLLRSVAAAFPESPIQAAVHQPLSDWPSSFAAMTEDVRLSVPAGK